jgi:uncharacterized HAD superfamily protein
MKINLINKRIGVDIDEVVVEFVKGYLKLVNNKLNSNFQFDEIKSYNLWENLKINRDEAFNLANLFYESDDFKNIFFVKDAKKSIDFLSKNNSLIFITSRPLEVKDKTISFFEKHFPNNNFKIIHSGDIFKNNLNKSEICVNEKIDFMIEDNGFFALECVKKNIPVFLMDKPWNKDFSHEKIIRVGGWDEILKNIK